MSESRTKFERRDYKENGIDISDHKIDQLYWYSNLFPNEIVTNEEWHDTKKPELGKYKVYGELPEEIFVSAIRFDLPKIKKRDTLHSSGRPEWLTVYGNGGSMAGVYFSGADQFETILYKDCRFDVSGERGVAAGILFDRVPTSVIHPFIGGGLPTYPNPGKRVYDILLDGSQVNRIKIEANIVEDRQKDTVDIFAVEDYKPTKIASIVQSKEGWNWINKAPMTVHRRIE